MIYETSTESYDFTNLFNYVVSSVNFDDIPAKRYTKENVIGRNGSIDFVDGLADRNATVKLTLKDGIDIYTREINRREIKRILNEQGFVTFDRSNDIKYKARVLDSSNINFSGNYDELYITFSLKPLAYSNVSEDTTWLEADISWQLADFTWDGTDTQETFTSGTHTITNRGNHVSYPIFIVNGAGTVTIGSQSFTVTEGCIVDTERMIVYENSTNKISSFSGDFIELPVGDSTLTTDVEIKVHNKDRWL